MNSETELPGKPQDPSTIGTWMVDLHASCLHGPEVPRQIKPVATKSIDVRPQGSRRMLQTGRIKVSLRTGQGCVAAYAFRDDGRLTIGCNEAYAPPVFLSPRCDGRIVRAYAETMLQHSLQRMGLL